MHVSAHLDVDVVAVETDDEVSVLVEVTAPDAPPPDPAVVRPVRTLQVVLDRSGSMGGGRIEGAIRALLAVVDRLDPTDNFGVAAFDDRVELTVPAGPLSDKPSAKRAIAALGARGSTDLSAGYLRGLQEARRVAGPAGATVLLISDGHANAGVVEPAALGALGAEARQHGVTTSTLGWGLGYDERLLAAIAEGGGGNQLFAEESDQAVALIASEVEGLLSQTAQAASMLIAASEHVTGLRLLNELSTSETAEGIRAELGSFYAGERRKILLTFRVPALAALGLVEVARLEFTYVQLPELTQHTVTVPLHINVVPGDVAAGRVPDATVRTEVVYQRVQQAKKRASGHLSDGAIDAALTEIEQAQAELAALGESVPAELAEDIAEEAGSLRYLAQEARHGDSSRAAKFSSADFHRKSTQRGRIQPPDNA